MTDWNGVTVEHLKKWLDENAGPRAGVAATDGKIIIFDAETGEDINTITVDTVG